VSSESRAGSQLPGFDATFARELVFTLTRVASSAKNVTSAHHHKIVAGKNERGAIARLCIST
jgi:hypothetical protein